MEDVDIASRRETSLCESRAAMFGGLVYVAWLLRIASRGGELNVYCRQILCHCPLCRVLFYLPRLYSGLYCLAPTEKITSQEAHDETPRSVA